MHGSCEEQTAIGVEIVVRQRCTVSRAYVCLRGDRQTPRGVEVAPRERLPVGLANVHLCERGHTGADDSERRTLIEEVFYTGYYLRQPLHRS